MGDKYLTTNQGAPVTDNQNSLTVGERGPVVLQDVHLVEKLATSTESESLSASYMRKVRVPMASSRCTRVWRSTPARTSSKTR